MLHCLKNVRVGTLSLKVCTRDFSSVVAAAEVPAVVKQNRLQPHAYNVFDISFLGSGGSNPSRFRGMPCMTLFLGGELWMFDAGEGTVRQTVYTRSCMDVTKIFITHMHADHIFGLPGVILNTDGRMQSLLPDKGEGPLMIYGPYGLYEYLCTCLRLSENTTHKTIIVHEMVASDEDAATLTDSEGRIPWRKVPSHYRNKPENLQGFASIQRVEVKSVNGLWSLVDEPRISVTARLVRHRIPCFGFVVKERDKGGPLLDGECKKRSVGREHFMNLKLGNDVTLADGTVVKAEDVTGATVKGRKLVYVGDTCDAATLAAEAMDCDVLVHEASAPESARTIAALRGHSTPIAAAEMALKCRAKKLVLNHIGGQFLPLKVTYLQTAGDKQIRSDWELYDEAIKPFGRPNDVIVARDFLTIKLPAGGYTSAHGNTGFDLDNSCVGPTHFSPVPKNKPVYQTEKSRDYPGKVATSRVLSSVPANTSAVRKIPIVNVNIANKMKNTGNTENIRNEKEMKIYTPAEKIPEQRTEHIIENRAEYVDEFHHEPAIVRGNERNEQLVYNEDNADKWKFNYTFLNPLSSNGLLPPVTRPDLSKIAGIEVLPYEPDTAPKEYFHTSGPEADLESPRVQRLKVPRNNKRKSDQKLP